jgi:acyl-CoA synthetase (AMP-forming)/AMP-acid ligase II
MFTVLSKVLKINAEKESNAKKGLKLRQIFGFSSLTIILGITKLKIADIKTGQSLGPNIDGEIWLRGPQIFSGYLNNIEATKQTIDSNGWLHTGDIGHYDQNERLFITDRIKEMIKYRRFPVSPVEIGQFFLTHEPVAEVAVFGIKHEINGRELMLNLKRVKVQQKTSSLNMSQVCKIYFFRIE